MNPSFALLIGIDRSDARLDLCTLDGAGGRPCAHTVSTNPRALHAWFDEQRRDLPEGARIAVAFEQPATNLIVFFSQFVQVTLYPRNPAAVRSYCKSFTISGAHTDVSPAVKAGFALVRTRLRVGPPPPVASGQPKRVAVRCPRCQRPVQCLGHLGRAPPAS